MRILVTGGCGFIGSNFIRYRLQRHGTDRIVNLDSLAYAGNLSSTGDFSHSPRYKFVKGSINDAAVATSLMKEIDWVVHFAAESHVDRSITDPGLFVSTNVLGTQVLLEAALKSKVRRFHHVSTDEVFGSLPLNSKLKFKEDSPYVPRSPYSASKASSDHLVRSYHHTYGLPVTVSNCSNNYGPYQHPEKFIPKAITNLILGRKVPVYGDGLYVRDWLFVEDHCRAIELILEKGKVGETYLVGGLKKNINNLLVIRDILKILHQNEDRLDYVQDRPGHDRRYAVSWSKIHRELGWKPRRGFKEQLRKTVFWYQKNRWWWEPLV